MQNLNLKKGIRGQLTIPFNNDTIKYLDENIEVFKGVLDRDTKHCLFDIYEATYQDQQVFGIEFDIRNKTFKEAENDLRLFKKEIQNHFGYRPKKILEAKYEKIF